MEEKTKILNKKKKTIANFCSSVKMGKEFNSLTFFCFLFFYYRKRIKDRIVYIREWRISKMAKL